MIILQLDSKQLSNIVQNAVHEALISASYSNNQNLQAGSNKKSNTSDKVRETAKGKKEVADGE